MAQIREMATFTINAEISVWTCARCGVKEQCKPTELRLKPAWTTTGRGSAWEVNHWSNPDRWLEASWGSGERLHACPDCAGHVQANLQKFAESLNLAGA